MRADRPNGRHAARALLLPGGKARARLETIPRMAARLPVAAAVKYGRAPGSASEFIDAVAGCSGPYAFSGSNWGGESLQRACKDATRIRANPQARFPARPLPIGIAPRRWRAFAGHGIHARSLERAPLGYILIDLPGFCRSMEKPPSTRVAKTLAPFLLAVAIVFSQAGRFLNMRWKSA